MHEGNSKAYQKKNYSSKIEEGLPTNKIVNRDYPMQKNQFKLSQNVPHFG